jgi:uncharacterized YccA/Bax inhibitor family protein
MARTESTNPALTRGPFAQAGRPVGFDRPQYGPAYGGPAQAPAPQGVEALEQAYYGPDATARDAGRMTTEDVVIRTAILLATAVVTGTLTWVTGATALLLPALVVGLGLGLWISFKQVTKPAPIIAYAATQGVLMGAFSQIITYGNLDVVLQAVIGTVGVALGVLFLYRSGRIRVTPQFTKMVLAGVVGFLVLAVTNLVAAFFIDGGLGLRDGSPLAIGFSLLAIGLAAMTLVVDFDFIDKGAQQGLPDRYGWYAAFSLMVSLVWLYIEIVRLISYFTGRE